jgi:hypothetical protein
MAGIGEVEGLLSRRQGGQGRFQWTVGPPDIEDPNLLWKEPL